jgi:RNA polymerase sigma-70 factor (ECF subfamily)
MPASSLAAALADAHGPAVRAYFRRAVGRADLADDLAQEVFLRVVRTSDFDARGRDRAWLFTIARHVLVDHVRRAGTRPITTAMAEDALETLPGSAVSAPQEIRLLLQRALETLDVQDREAFLLAEVAGLSYAEIGVVLELSHAAVRSRVFRARLALRIALAARPKGSTS